MLEVKLGSADAAKSVMSLGSILKGVGISLAVTLAIQGITMLIEAQQKAIDKGNEIVSQWQEQQKVLKSNGDAISSIKSEYEELSKGVSDSGKNISLSTESYSRYNEIVNQIADMFPEMIKGYTDEGNAILIHKGNVDALTEAYEAQKLAAQDAIRIGANDVIKGYNASVNQSGLLNFNSKASNINYLQRFIDGQETTDVGLLTEEADLFRAAGIDLGVTDSVLEKANAEKDKVISYLRTLQREVNMESSKLKQIFSFGLETNELFNGLDASVQDAVNNIIDSLDYSFFRENMFFTDQDIYNWIDNSIIAPLTDPSMSQEVQNALTTLFDTDSIDTKSLGAYTEEMKAAFEKLTPELQDLMEPILIKLGIDFDIEDTRKQLADKLSNLPSQSIDALMGMKTEQEIDFILNIDDDRLNAFKGSLIDFLKLLDEIEADAQQLDFNTAFDKLEGSVSGVSKALAQQIATGKMTREMHDELVQSLDAAGVEEKDYKDLIVITSEGYELAVDKAKEFINTLVEQEIQTQLTAGATEEEIDSLRGLFQTYDDLATNLGNVKTNSNLFSTAKQEMEDLNEISDETFQQLASVTGDISKYLDIQNGKLIFNAKAWNENEGAVKAAEKAFKDYAKANPLGSRTEEQWELLQYLYEEWQRQAQGIEKTTDVISKLNTELDDIQSAYAAVEGAQEELNDEGYISIDTYQSLLEISPKYLQLLIDEQGNLTLTKDALEAVTKARIEELAQKSALALLDTVSAYEDETTALANLKGDIEGVTGSLIELNAEKLEEIRLNLGEDVFKQVEAQIKNIEKSRDAALRAIGQGKGYTAPKFSSKKETEPYKAEIEATMVLESQLTKINELLTQNEKIFANTKATESLTESNNELANSYKKIAEEAKKAMKEASDEWNSLVNGNVDYNKRNVLTGSDLIKHGWNDVAPEDFITTITSGEYIKNAQGQEFAITVTPILDDGTILTPEDLSDYVWNVLDGANNILEADKYGIVVNAEVNKDNLSGDWFDWEGFENGLINAKEKHLDSWAEMQDALGDYEVAIRNVNNSEKNSEQAQLLQKRIDLLKEQKSLTEQINSVQKTEILNNVNKLAEYGIKIKYEPDINMVSFEQSTDEMQSILNGISVGDVDKSNDFRKELESMLEDVSKLNESCDQNKTEWLGIKDAINEVNYQLLQLDYSESVENDTESIEQLDKEIDALAESDTASKLALIEKQMNIQTSAAERDKNQIQALREAFDRGDISALQMQNGIKEITNSMIDSTIAARDYQKSIDQINLDKFQTELDASNNIVDLTKQMIQQEIADKVEGIELEISDIEISKDVIDNAIDDLNEDMKNRDDVDDATKDNLDKQFENFKDNYDDRKEIMQDNYDIFKDINDQEQEDLKDTFDEADKLADKERDRLDDELKAADKLSDKEKDRLNDELKLADKLSNAEKDRLDETEEAVQKADDEREEALQNQLEEIQDLNDAKIKGIEDEINLINEAAEARQKALDDELDKYKSIIDARKESLQDEANSKSYADELAEKQLELSKIQDRIDELANNNSSDARAERFQLEENKVAQQKEIDDFIYQHSLDSQLSALDREWERYSQLKEDEKELLDQQLEDDIAAHENEIAQIEAEQEALEVAHEAEMARMEENAEQRQAAYDDAIAKLEAEDEARQLAHDEAIEKLETEDEARQLKYDLEIERMESEDEARQLQYEQDMERLESEAEREQEVYDKNMDNLDAEMEREQDKHDQQIENIEIANERYDDLINSQIEAYERDLEAYDKSIEEKQLRIDELNESIANSGDLTIMAMERIDERSHALLGDLIQWNAIYGTGISEDITGAWLEYLDVVDRGNNSTLQNTLSLMQQIRDTAKSIKEESADISNVSSYNNLSSNSSKNSFSSNSSSQIPVRAALEAWEYEVDWNDDNDSFTVTNPYSGKSNTYDGSQYDYKNGSLYATSSQWDDLVDSLPKYAKGGYIYEDGPIYVHKNERVLNPKETKEYDMSQWTRLEPPIMPKGIFDNMAYNAVDNIRQNFSDMFKREFNNIASLVNSSQPTVSVDSHDEIRIDGVTSENFINEILPKFVDTRAQAKVDAWQKSSNSRSRMNGVTGKFSLR